MKNLIVLFWLFHFSIKCQSIYIRPLLVTNINNYSANEFFNDYAFTQNGINYHISSPNFKLNPRVNFGLNIGVKRTNYFLEIGLCTDQVSSETNIKISNNILTKSLHYFNQVNVFRSPINAGLKIFEKEANQTKTSKTHQFWFIFGVDLIYRRVAYQEFENFENFSLDNNNFTIKNEYGFYVSRFWTTINLGLEYKFQNKQHINIFCLRVNYILNHRGFDSGLGGSVTITHNGPLGQIIYYYPVKSSFNGIYLSISREFNLNKRTKNDLKHPRNIQ